MARNSRPLTRRAGTAIEAETIVIVCEGVKTEEIYFNGIRKEYRLATARINFIGLGADPLTVVRRAEELKSDYDHAWAVFDVESAGHHGQRHPSLEAAIARADRAGIRCAISHPCFELWLILHFRLHTAYLTNDKARSIARDLPFDYDDKGFDFDKLWPYRETALKNADQLDRRKRQDYPSMVDRNPWTSVHELVTRLLTITGGADPGEAAQTQQNVGSPSRVGTDQARGRRHSGR
ncbi:RloB family protein [Dactylosporangium sp. CA-233914]|uniref:RloB family protein n=1 Tax=Dactylosporangium sp. CA-233914 TaxID=3239934 RepID=UPI003D8CD647